MRKYQVQKQNRWQKFNIYLYCITLIAIVLGTSSFYTAHAQAQNDVKLVLQITVDGLRGDLIKRYEKGFGSDGFKALMKKGAYYTNAHYQYANTETIVGHATLATGTFPSQHGMVGNVWFDREAGELAYNIEDPDHPVIPTRENETTGAQVDPAQKKSRTQGRSPSVLLAPTFGDGLMAYFGKNSKVFGISGKDRSAVSMAGHSGKAFWFSTNTGDFVTSSYYYKTYPEWVIHWNDKRQAEAYAGKSWTLLNDISTYHLGDNDDRPYEVDLKGYGRVFPHPFGEVDDPLFNTRILVSPVGDQLLLDFAKSLVENEELGTDDTPDYLSISFSGVDAINHFFGPSSLENEDVVVQLDRTLADLFSFIDKSIGLKHTLIVLSADHGMADMPEYMTELGFKAGRLEPGTIIAAANKAGKTLGVDGVVLFYYRPYLYLDEKKLAEAKIDLAHAEQVIADTLTNLEGLSLAVPSSSLKMKATNPLVKMVRNNHHVSRSGNIYTIQDPYWFLFDKGPVAAMHGSPWQYDTHVPIIFWGPTIKAQKVNRLVHPVDVAPTMAMFLGMSPPGSAQGVPLIEVFE